jgi:hypothetical protein
MPTSVGMTDGDNRVGMTDGDNRVGMTDGVNRRVCINAGSYKCFDIGVTTQSRHGGRRPAIHAVSETRTASRGWRACARHDGERLAALTGRFGYFATSPKTVRASLRLPLSASLPVKLW